MRRFVYRVLSLALVFSAFGIEAAFAESDETKQMLVVFDEELSVKKIGETLDDVGVEVSETYGEVSVAKVEVTESSLQELLDNPSVKYVEEDIIVKQSVQRESYGIQLTHIPSAWNSNFTGKGVKVAVIDSGIAIHQDLKIAGGVSTVDYTTSYHDDQGHGTHVAGIIAARNNGFGVKGVAYDTELYAVKAFNQDGEAYLSDIVQGINWSINNDIDIINLSSGSEENSAIFHSTIDKAYTSGLLIVAAAGNDGAYDGLDDSVDFPARYSSVIGVGAVNRYSKRASFSSTGPAVEIAAPGVEILSTYVGNEYAYLSGTSMAAPFVTGELALLKQAYPGLTNKELRRVLTELTQDIGAVGRDTLYGYGLMQATSFTEKIDFPRENPLTGLSVNRTSFTGEPGENINLTATASFKDGKIENVTNIAQWSSANVAVATVTNGKVELIGYGSTTVTVSYDGQTAIIIVDVPEPEIDANPVVKLEVNNTFLLGKPGDILKVEATATLKDGTVQNVTSEANWTSANTAIATVTAGVVELKGYGSTTLMATYKDHSSMVVVNSPNPQPTPKFKDVTSFYAPAVEYLVQKQITSGLSQTTFGIDKDIIRADAAIWLAKELNLNTQTAKASGFADVPERAVGAVNALKAAGIIGGKTSSSFGAYDPLTRGEVAIILQRAYDLSANGTTSSFTDVSPRYKDAVDALVANNITSGLTATRFGVSQNITRGQLAVFIYRLSDE